MKIFKSIEEFIISKSGLGKLTFIPTMGNLHKGHASLIDIGKEFKNDVISTIYINKLQFNDQNDYLRYPKSLDNDIELLERHGCNYLLIPDDTILDEIISVKAPSKFNKLCGKNRPGHFDGVLTILNKMFKIIEPEIAIFGKKDYQQFVLVKDFIKENNLNIKIIGAETIREESGLALSSRNNLLTNNEKLIAKNIYKVLIDLKDNKQTIGLNFVNSKIKYLENLGIKVDYLSCCDPESFEESYNINEKDLLIAIAAYVGNVRLIDNIKLTKL